MLVVTAPDGRPQHKQFTGQLSEILPASPNDIASDFNGPYENNTNNPSLHNRTDAGSQNGSLLNENVQMTISQEPSSNE